MSTKKLPAKWLYIFSGIALAAGVTGIVALYKKEYFIAICMAIIFIAQVLNLAKWFKQK